MSGEEASLVLREQEEKVVTLTLNRPAKLNALNEEMLEQLDVHISDLSRDEDVRAVVLAGAGRAFCAGADVSDVGAGEGPRDHWNQYENARARQESLWALPQPVIAAVHGYCLGRGLELALWADIVIASEDASIGQPEVRDGSVIASIIPWLTSPHLAKLFMLTGDRFSAAEAHEMGLISRVVSDRSALSEAMELAHKLSHIPAVTARAIKQFVNKTYQLRGATEAQAYGSLLASLVRGLAPSDEGMEELARIRELQGFKAYIEARDRPFQSD